MQMGSLLKVLMVIGVFFLNQITHAQEASVSESIEWDEGRLLTWSDYRLRTLRSKQEMALTSVKHSVRGYVTDDVPAFEVKVLFVKEDSWTSDTTNMALLHHEQLHFDIGELYRRKIEASIHRLQRDGEKQKAVYRYVIKKLLSDFRNFQQEYDQQTRFGNIKSEQQKWRDKVWEALKRLQ